MNSHVTAIDRQARNNLQSALAQYMTGEIRTFAFDDRNSEYLSPGSSFDSSVLAISRALYGIHDDLVDHPISVTSEGWSALRRVVAFLGTDLHVSDAKDAAWPFCDVDQWRRYEPLLNEFALPDFDPLIHNRPINHWSRRIPTSVGLAIIIALLAVVMAIVAFSS